MLDRFFGAFQHQTQEQKQIVLMLCTGFFMGVFLATYQVTADSLFLNRMGDQLDKAFLVAGAMGMLTTAIFSMFQNWLKFCPKQVEMTLRASPSEFCPKLLGCLARGEQKWHKNANLMNLSVSRAVIYFLSCCVLKAES